jgi:hypothetical protein
MGILTMEVAGLYEVRIAGRFNAMGNIGASVWENTGKNMRT